MNSKILFYVPLSSYLLFPQAQIDVEHGIDPVHQQLSTVTSQQVAHHAMTMVLEVGTEGTEETEVTGQSEIATSVGAHLLARQTSTDMFLARIQVLLSHRIHWRIQPR
jgi:hypothetical protein